MGLELKLLPDQLTEDELVMVFRCFCEAYGLTQNAQDETFIRSDGLINLRSNGELIYNLVGRGMFTARKEVRGYNYEKKRRTGCNSF